MTENSPVIDVQARANRAQNLLNDPTLKDAIATVRGVYTKAMIETQPDDAKTRDHFHRCIHALTDIEQALTAFIQSGKIEAVNKVKQERAKNG